MRMFNASFDLTPVTAQKSGPSALWARTAAVPASSGASMHTM